MAQPCARQAERRDCHALPFFWREDPPGAASAPPILPARRRGVRHPRWHGRCSLAVRAAMSERPRVIIALSDRAESAVLAGWLAEDGFEPVRRPTPHTAVEEMRSRPYD